MSLTVTQRPDQNGVWVAAKNPVIYKMTRKDYAWTLLVTSAGNTSIRIATNVTANFVTGDTIWLESDDGAYSATGLVVSSVYGTYTTVVTNIPYVANNASGYINTTIQRTNYYVAIGVYRSSDNTLIGTVNYYPTKKGLLIIDVSQPLQSILDPSISQILNGIILQDSNTTEGFYIKYTEHWTSSGESTTSDSGNVFYAIYGALQVGSIQQFDNSTFQTSLSPWLQSGDNSLYSDWIFHGNSDIRANSTMSLAYTQSVIIYSKKTLGSWKAGTYRINFIGNNSSTGPSATGQIKIYGTNADFLGYPYSMTGIDYIGGSGDNALYPITPTGAFNLTYEIILTQDYSSIGFFFAVDASGTTTFQIDISSVKLISITSLIPLDSLNLFINEYFCLSYLSLGGALDWIKKKWYDSGGVLLCSSFIKSTNNTAAFAGTSVPQSVYTFFQKLTLTEIILPDRNFTNGGTIAWTSNSLLIATGATSKTWSSPFFLAKTYSITLNYNFNLNGNATDVTPRLYLFDSLGNVLSGDMAIFTGSSGNYSGAVTITNSGVSDAYFIGFNFANASGANKTLSLNSLIVTIPDSAMRIDFSGVTLIATTYYSETGILFDTISGYIQSCSKNSITLMWRNLLGGESSFTFNYNQDLIQKLQDSFKNKQLTLYDQNITLAQFNCLNDLFSLGNIYQTPLIEFTTSIDKTEARIGQQVYMVDSNGVKTGVIVIPGENKTWTKKNRHNFQVTIELPEIFG